MKKLYFASKLEVNISIVVQKRRITQTWIQMTQIMKSKGTSAILVNLFVTLMVILSCTENPNSINQSLTLAKELMELQPDSALKILKSIDDPEEMSEKHFAEYGLLMAQAQDKNYITNKIDTALLKNSAAYYKKNNDEILFGLCSYYIGRWLHETRNAKEAMDYFLKAENILENSKHYKFVGLFYEEMGNTNLILENYDSSLKDFRKSLEYYSLINDSACITFAYRNIGRVYLRKMQRDSAYYYYDRALNIAVRNKFPSRATILADIGLMYRGIKRYDEAEKYLFEALDNTKVDDDKYSIYLSLGYLYYRMGRLQDAEDYYRKSLSATKSSIVSGAYFRLYWLEKGRSNFERAIMYK